MVAVEPKRSAWPSIHAELQRWHLHGHVLSDVKDVTSKTFDVAVLCQVLCSTAEPLELLRVIRRLLRPGPGHAFLGISEPCAASLWLQRQ